MERVSFPPPGRSGRVPLLWSQAFPSCVAPSDRVATVRLWESVAPPLGLLVDGDEGASEIDVIIESASWVWFIEAKYRSDISTGTTTRPDRDQIVRNLDVGSNYAGVRRFFFSLLVSSEQRSPIGMQRLREYQDLEVVRTKLERHRPDRLMNLEAIGSLTWVQLGATLAHAEVNAPHEDERLYANRAVAWLRDRGHTIGAV